MSEGEPRPQPEAREVFDPRMMDTYSEFFAAYGAIEALRDVVSVKYTGEPLDRSLDTDESTSLQTTKSLFEQLNFDQVSGDRTQIEEFITSAVDGLPNQPGKIAHTGKRLKAASSQFLDRLSRFYTLLNGEEIQPESYPAFLSDLQALSAQMNFSISVSFDVPYIKPTRLGVSVAVYQDSQLLGRRNLQPPAIKTLAAVVATQRLAEMLGTSTRFTELQLREITQDEYPHHTLDGLYQALRSQRQGGVFWELLTRNERSQYHLQTNHNDVLSVLCHKGSTSDVNVSINETRYPEHRGLHTGIVDDIKQVPFKLNLIPITDSYFDEERAEVDEADIVDLVKTTLSQPVEVFPVTDVEAPVVELLPTPPIVMDLGSYPDVESLLALLDTPVRNLLGKRSPLFKQWQELLTYGGQNIDVPSWIRDENLTLAEIVEKYADDPRVPWCGQLRYTLRQAMFSSLGFSADDMPSAVTEFEEPISKLADEVRNALGVMPEIMTPVEVDPEERHISTQDVINQLVPGIIDSLYASGVAVGHTRLTYRPGDIIAASGGARQFYPKYEALHAAGLLDMKGRVIKTIKPLGMVILKLLGEAQIRSHIGSISDASLIRMLQAGLPEALELYKGQLQSHGEQQDAKGKIEIIDRLLESGQ